LQRDTFAFLIFLYFISAKKHAVFSVLSSEFSFFLLYLKLLLKKTRFKKRVFFITQLYS